MYNRNPNHGYVFISLVLIKSIKDDKEAGRIS